MSELVSIIIPTMGKRELLFSCLKSVKEQSYKNIEVLIINNSSDKGLENEIRDRCPFGRIYTSQSNLYYCGSMNKGIQDSRGSLILCLNDDVVLEPEYLRRTISGFAVSSEVGMVCGKILRKDKKTIDSAGLFLSLCWTAKERGYGSLDKGQFEKKRFIFGVCGAVALYRREMLFDIAHDNVVFDPDFNIFYEDLDISWRAKRKGWKAFYVPQAIAYHCRGGSVRTGSVGGRSGARQHLDDDRHFDLIKNRYLVIIKNASPLGLVFHLLPISIYEVLLWGYILLFRPQMIKRIGQLFLILRQRIVVRLR